VTNLSSKKKNKKLLTPERAVLFVPASAGILIGIILIITLFYPEFIKIRNKNADINVLKQKIEYIPSYEKKLSNLLNLLRKRIAQSNRLINLVAGESELRTILAKLNEISIKNSVRIIELKPDKTIEFTPKKEKSNSSDIAISSTQKISNNQSDKLLIPTIKKYPFNLSFVGQYDDIINFIRDLELLETIVLSSGLELKLNETNKYINYNSNKKNQAPINMISAKLKLTFYGRNYQKVEL